jgi:hypothetical protein
MAEFVVKVRVRSHRKTLNFSWQSVENKYKDGEIIEARKRKNNKFGELAKDYLEYCGILRGTKGIS